LTVSRHIDEQSVMNTLRAAGFTTVVYDFEAYAA